MLRRYGASCPSKLPAAPRHGQGAWSELVGGRCPWAVGARAPVAVRLARPRRRRRSALPSLRVHGAVGYASASLFYGEPSRSRARLAPRWTSSGPDRAAPLRSTSALLPLVW
ncbi:hypothetical protein PVAP13_6NG306850 [Panicum virgatum]|uniref:Uncharacterized protein n=1 Tax=Panicum virgatum TaxID=38727 RepID=A0A8T0R3A5_PANVG|nr:hypothetical protein PVAP13_6NG306850 [Panicum virgatum]